MDIVVASTEADLIAVEAIKDHHAAMAGALGARVSAVQQAARSGQGVTAARDAVVAWSRDELLPHAAAEEQTIYAAAESASKVGCWWKHSSPTIASSPGWSTVSRTPMMPSPSPARLPRWSRSSWRTWRRRTTRCSRSSPPTRQCRSPSCWAACTTSSAGTSAPTRCRRSPAATAAAAAASGTAAGDVELDARGVPHAIRHATIFGALDSLRADTALVLVAPHDPLPLLAQLEQRSPGAFEVSYLERGPEAWRLRLLRRAA